MFDTPRILLNETTVPTRELELLRLTLDHAEAAMQLIDAAATPRLHAALLVLLSRLGHEIEKVMQLGGC